MDIMQSGPHNF